MIWKIEFDINVEKELKKLDRQAQKAILKYLRERIATSKNPRDFGKALLGDKSGFWRYRINHYRIICRINDAELIVLVVKVGHRKDVYN